MYCCAELYSFIAFFFPQATSESSFSIMNSHEFLDDTILDRVLWGKLNMILVTMKRNNSILQTSGWSYYNSKITNTESQLCFDTKNVQEYWNSWNAVGGVSRCTR